MQRKLFAALPVLFVASILASPAAEAAFMFRSQLSGSQEVPPAATAAGGSATLSLDDAMTRLEINIQIFGLDLDGLQTPLDPLDNVVAAHIHRAPFGVNGPVVFGFISPNNDTNGDLVIDPVAGTIFSAWDLAEGNGTTLAAELANLFDSGFYLNFHTPAFPGGEIRGQIQPVPEPTTLALWTLGAVAIVGISRRRSKRAAAT